MKYILLVILLAAISIHFASAQQACTSDSECLAHCVGNRLEEPRSPACVYNETLGYDACSFLGTNCAYNLGGICIDSGAGIAYCSGGGIAPIPSNPDACLNVQCPRQGEVRCNGNQICTSTGTCMNGACNENCVACLDNAVCNTILEGNGNTRLSCVAMQTQNSNPSSRPIGFAPSGSENTQGNGAMLTGFALIVILAAAAYGVHK